ncbi:uncharacterized protein HMPREF1541_00690 [Cyphellophora europaea CBS 101466]|uniref:Wax synthase domain-containing protein n=1 Tax=Cyphellophora europaea (strain CBS 101466) TaxID=1220924 RepID=W2SD09_CYPE1|nr:uncharacterized protein HMPREF1541_00690 [Cyphellophora europaea CBS 101466]ETN46505.1 hypothetical protein HMPREF1541_00690 [Cyphellophora europaea CBS 101466]
MSADALYRQVQADRLQRYEDAITTGVYRPYIWPWDTLPALWLFLGLLILPRLPGKTARIVRIPLLALIFGQGAWTCMRARSIQMAGGYGIGLTDDWGFIMTAALLCFSDLKQDFQRLEARPIGGSAPVEDHTGSAQSTATEANGSLTERTDSRMEQKPSSTLGQVDESRAHPYTVDWQSYPSDIKHCVLWITDLLISFRGVNWNYRLVNFHPFHSAPQNPFEAERPDHKSRTAEKTAPPSINDIQRKARRSAILLYLGLDLAKTLVIHDPYYFGLAPIDSPHPLWLLQSHPFLTRLCRLLLSLYSIIVALSCIFNLSPLLFPLLPDFSTQTGHPISHPSMYPPLWSPTPITDLLRGGLPAFWGKIWHQMFRFGISQPSAYLIRRYHLNPRSQSGRALQLLIAFGLTASIHAMAAATSFPPNPLNPPRPITGSGLFFVLQALGMLAQTAFAEAVGSKKRWPVGARKAGNAAFVVVWLWYTGPILSDDFARTGVWMFEPLPISLFRGLAGEGWWCWGGRWAGLVWDGPWYRRGIALY